MKKILIAVLLITLCSSAAFAGKKRKKLYSGTSIGTQIQKGDVLVVKNRLIIEYHSVRRVSPCSNHSLVAPQPKSIMGPGACSAYMRLAQQLEEEKKVSLPPGDLSPEAKKSQKSLEQMEHIIVVPYYGYAGYGIEVENFGEPKETARFNHRWGNITRNFNCSLVLRSVPEQDVVMEAGERFKVESVKGYKISEKYRNRVLLTIHGHERVKAIWCEDDTSSLLEALGNQTTVHEKVPGRVCGGYKDKTGNECAFYVDGEVDSVRTELEGIDIVRSN